MLKLNLKTKKYQGSRVHIIDVSAVMMANQNNYMMGEMSWVVDGERVNTKALFGILRQLSKLGIKDKFVFCMDSKENDRKAENADYKSGRPKATEDYIYQLYKAEEILKNSGFLVLKEAGIEADDFIVYSANKLKEHYDHVFIHTNDYDMGQNVDDNVYFINIKTKLSDITKENYEEVLKCPYNSIILYKATVGDGSDMIKGIKGFGDKAFSTFVSWVEANGYDFSSIRANNLEEEIIRNSTLHESEKEQALDCLNLLLPREPKEEIDVKGLLERQKTDLQTLKWYLEQFGMNSIVKSLKL